MNIRKALAGMALVGTLTVGGYAGVATPQTTAPTNPTAQNQTSCERAHDHVARLHSRIGALKDRIARPKGASTKLRATATTTGRPAREAHRHRKGPLDKLETRVAAMEARVDQRCARRARPRHPRRPNKQSNVVRRAGTRLTCTRSARTRDHEKGVR